MAQSCPPAVPRELRSQDRRNFSTTYEAHVHANNPNPGDDGWWIDNVTISNTLTNAAVVTNDDDAPVLTGCGLACNTVTASVAADPSGGLASPGQTIELDASGSTADRCLNGVLQYRFSDQGGLRRDWTDNPVFIDAPQAPSTYTVDVRCSELTSCNGTVNQVVAVACPSSGSLSFGISMGSKTTITFDSSRPYDSALDGDLTTSFPDYTTAVTSLGNAAATTFDVSGNNPTSGNGFWYLFQEPGGAAPFCNEVTDWTSGGTSEEAGRNADLP